MDPQEVTRQIAYFTGLGECTKAQSCSYKATQ